VTGSFFDGRTMNAQSMEPIVIERSALKRDLLESNSDLAKQRLFS